MKHRILIFSICCLLFFSCTEETYEPVGPDTDGPHQETEITEPELPDEEE